MTTWLRAEEVSAQIAALVPSDRLPAVEEEVARRYATGRYTLLDALESVYRDLAAARFDPTRRSAREIPRA